MTSVHLKCDSYQLDVHPSRSFLVSGEDRSLTSSAGGMHQGLSSSGRRKHPSLEQSDRSVR